MSSKQKPWLLVCASPAAGHTNPMVNMARELVQRSYEVAFIAGEQFKESFVNVGAKSIGIVPSHDEALFVERLNVPNGIERLQFDMRKFFLDTIESRKQVLYTALEKMHEQAPEREIVIVTESWYLGTLPLYFGAAPPNGFSQRPRIVNIHAATYMATSIDAAPFGLALPPDCSEQGRIRNQALHQEMLNGPWKELNAEQGDILAALGATDFQPDMLLHVWTTSHDVTLQMCPPSLEYPVSDLHPKVKFVGALGPKPAQDGTALPEFWNEVTRGDKKVVVVTQGTVNEDFNQLIIPTFEALADRDDLLVVAILGTKGAKIEESVKIPSNARVVDYLRYDTILAFASVFVTNAGYGGFIHGVVNGVPMVLGGGSEDKPEVANRGEFAGVGINLKTDSPSREQVAEAVEKVLTDPSFKNRVMEIKRENEDMKVMDRVEEAIAG
ncbi:hypothetical protein FSARC_7821 [Fusarium sarcochroum]|uniref:UDP-glucosyltransferase n=1 Tax=Fusarium sarcochroum TaxID=1208366 RepID=A0A8H4TU91_9HYPO|nr:hypothetical protein FSARC_7821 [Fusarium sarcochroum]